MKALRIQHYSIMKALLHPDFKLNDESFSSIEALRNHAFQWVKNGKDDEIEVGKFILEWLDDNDFIYVKTSGSTGIPKTIKLQKEHVRNSANATVAYFDLKEGTRALLCLSSEYIAGKMMLVRAMTAGWNLYTSSPEKNPLAKFDENFDFTAMVPYQVHHSLAELHKVKKIIVGGGAVSKKLENQLQQLETEVFATYGMTETISHVAIRRLNGEHRSTIFNALPNISFSQNNNACLQVHAPEISKEIVVTNDVVELISPISFKFLGRIDNVINTGGVKVHPEMIEEKLAEHITQPFFIASEKDAVFGERVILIIENQIPLKLNDFADIFKVLSAYEKPRNIYSIPEFIYTETGKIRRKKSLQAIVSS